MLNEFKSFAMRGNVVDMAVGIIIGAAFGKIVSSFVNDVIMPPIGLLMGNVDFSNLFITLSGESYATLAEAREAGAVTLNYGQFLTRFLDFLIVAFAIFILVKQVQRVSGVPATTDDEKECPQCLMAIPVKATRCGHCTKPVKS